MKPKFETLPEELKTQVLSSFKNNSKEPIDAFIRFTEDQRIEDYQVSNNLIFFRLWASPEMEGISTIPLNVGKINYSDFEYFRGIIKQEINHQWRSFLHKKRDISKAALAENRKEPDTGLVINEESPPPAPTPKLSDIFVQEYDIPHRLATHTNTAPQEVLAPQNDVAVIDKNQGSQTFKVIAYILLTLGVLSILGKLFGGN